MSKIQEKPVKSVEKVKKGVAKKVKQVNPAAKAPTTKAPVKVPAKAVLAEKIPKLQTVSVEKKTPVPKKVSRVVDRLSAHALKHVSSWHAKAGADGPEFAKLLAKHARTLLK